MCSSEGCIHTGTEQYKPIHFVLIQETLTPASRLALTVRRAAALQLNQRPLLKLEDRRRKRMQAVLKVMKIWR